MRVGPLTVLTPAGGGAATATLSVGGLRTVDVSGNGVGVTAVNAVRGFTPAEPLGDLQIVDMVLPTVQPNDHHLTLVAMAPVPSLDGWALQWIDAIAPAEPVLYARLPPIALDDGQRLRPFPGLD
jgi:hypothetical protein